MRFVFEAFHGLINIPLGNFSEVSWRTWEIWHDGQSPLTWADTVSPIMSEYTIPPCSAVKSTCYVEQSNQCTIVPWPSSAAGEEITPIIEVISNFVQKLLSEHTHTDEIDCCAWNTIVVSKTAFRASPSNICTRRKRTPLVHLLSNPSFMNWNWRAAVSQKETYSLRHRQLRCRLPETVAGISIS